MDTRSGRRITSGHPLESILKMGLFHQIGDATGKGYESLFPGGLGQPLVKTGEKEIIGDPR
jgi:hypothetical protein